MRERAAFRSTLRVLLAFLFLILPAAGLAEETEAPSPALPAQAPETPGATSTFAPSAPEAVPTAPVPILDEGTAPAAPPEAAPPVPAEAAPPAPGEAASPAPAEAVPPAPGEAAPPAPAEAAPPAPAEAGSAAPPAAAPSAEMGSTKAAEYPNGLIHSVVQGDTLWDLSAKYLGSPWRWTELWERNRFLTNPHYIYPGIRIVIFPPPPKEYAMEVVEPGAEPEATPAVAPPQPPPPAEEPTPPGAPAAVAERRTLSITPSEYVRAGEFLLNRPSGIGRIAGAAETRVVFA